MKKFTQLFVLFYITIQSSCLIAQEVPNWLKDKPKDVKAGFALYKDKGCFLCHGYSGQGSPMSGPITTFINALPAPTDPDSIKLLKK